MVGRNDRRLHLTSTIATVPARERRIKFFLCRFSSLSHLCDNAAHRSASGGGEELGSEEAGGHVRLLDTACPDVLEGLDANQGNVNSYRSDADADVLADYVLALIRTDAPDEEIRKASEENLEDFLRERSCAGYSRTH